MLANASHSGENLAYQLRDHLASKTSDSTDDIKSYIRKSLLEEGLGVHDATDEEVNSLVDNSEPWPASYIFSDIISRRAQVGWTTHGHSAVDVNIYASNAKDAHPLQGNHENTEVGDFIRDYLGVDLEPITKELKEKGALFDTLFEDGTTQSWMGKPVPEDNNLDHLDHYHGDFKRSLELEHAHAHVH